MTNNIYDCAAMAVSEWPAAIFLQDIVPKRMPLSDLIKRLRDTEQPQNGTISACASACSACMCRPPSLVRVRAMAGYLQTLCDG